MITTDISWARSFRQFEVPIQIRNCFFNCGHFPWSWAGQFSAKFSVGLFFWRLSRWWAIKETNLKQAPITDVRLTVVWFLDSLTTFHLTCSGQLWYRLLERKCYRSGSVFAGVCVLVRPPENPRFSLEVLSIYYRRSFRGASTKGNLSHHWRL